MLLPHISITSDEELLTNNSFITNLCFLYSNFISIIIILSITTWWTFRFKRIWITIKLWSIISYCWMFRCIYFNNTKNDEQLFSNPVYKGWMIALQNIKYIIKSSYLPFGFRSNISISRGSTHCGSTSKKSWMWDSFNLWRSWSFPIRLRYALLDSHPFVQTVSRYRRSKK